MMFESHFDTCTTYWLLFIQSMSNMISTAFSVLKATFRQSYLS